MVTIPDFEDKGELLKWLVANKSSLIAQKKSAVKFSDAISYVPSFVAEKGEEVIKAESIAPEATKIKVRSIINTTKLFDSHGDVHIDQLWNKSLKEGDKYLAQEHQFNFQGIISDNVKAMVKQMDWHELGINFEGKTQALVFDSIIERKANWPLGTDMFEMYRMGKVKQHSVGMQYIKVDLAVNDERYDKEYAIWQKYFDEIANKDEVLVVGYFWAVTEAKFREGSAVLAGSNWATPTQSITQVKNQPASATDTDEPPVRTPKIDFEKFYQPSKHI